MKWNSIETFFLDMDGTLLDLAFDNFFWHEHLPKIYSESKKISFNAAKSEFESMYKKKENTMQWYSLRHWSEVLKIDLLSELLMTKNKIKTLPKAKGFLSLLKKNDIKVFLLTNCPRDMLHVKLSQTKLWGYFDEIVSSEDFNFPKESIDFWDVLNEKYEYNNDTTVFLDDSKNVIDFSLKHGLRNVFLISSPDSSKKDQDTFGYKSIKGVNEFKKMITS